jgi:hypothetical protein
VYQVNKNTSNRQMILLAVSDVLGAEMSLGLAAPVYQNVFRYAASYGGERPNTSRAWSVSSCYKTTRWSVFNTLVAQKVISRHIIEDEVLSSGLISKSSSLFQSPDWQGHNLAYSLKSNDLRNRSTW